MIRVGIVGTAVLLLAALAACGKSGRETGADPIGANSISNVSTSPIGSNAGPQATAAAPPVKVSSPAATATKHTVSPTLASKPPAYPRQHVDPPRIGIGQFSNANLAIAASVRGRLVRYAVQVEGGVPVDPRDFAGQVHTTLTDPRGWQGVDGVAFEAVTDPSEAAFIVTLATPDTTDRLCAPLDTGGYLDCFNGTRAVINSDRWLLGAMSWGNDITGYRHQVLNHEVGHALGHGHRYCPAPGKPAPVMQQQTISLQNCTPNAWPSITDG